MVIEPTQHERWLLFLDDGPGLSASAVGHRLAEACDANCLVVHHEGDRIVEELTSTGRAIVVSAPTSTREWPTPDALMEIAGSVDVPVLTVGLDLFCGLTDIGDDPRRTSENADAILTPEQIVAIVRPVLMGPRRLSELSGHIERRRSILALGGQPLPGHDVVERLASQVASDSVDERLLDRWGQSTIVDENTGLPVITATTFDWLDQAWGKAGRPGWPVSHAGLLHTYGYMISTAWTPFGWKADRYLDGTLATLLDVDPDSLTPWCQEGTVLSNLTRALDDMIAGHRPEYLIEEVGQLVDGAGQRSDGALRTRIYLRPGTDDRLLVYSIELAGTGERFITSFPMARRGVEGLLADTEPRSRFNAAVALEAGHRQVVSG